MQPVLFSPTRPQASSRRARDASKQGPWRCSNCPKEFAQKEYRYKHQQRCIQSSQRQKLSKQKSCTACAASKLSCDLGTPSCSRCINRNKTCRYVSASNPNATSQQIEAAQRPRGHHIRADSGQPYDNNSVVGDNSSLSNYSTRRQSELELEAVMQDAGDRLSNHTRMV
ncbi:hypothetical protein QL093DRAFT_2465102 [Fusarium oxysporum]|nr:hypothetical protein QL093DRAFT_2465102 [Fusarium oxysporum]